MVAVLLSFTRSLMAASEFTTTVIEARPASAGASKEKCTVAPAFPANVGTVTSGASRIPATGLPLKALTTRFRAPWSPRLATVTARVAASPAYGLPSCAGLRLCGQRTGQHRAHLPLRCGHGGAAGLADPVHPAGALCGQQPGGGHRGLARRPAGAGVQSRR